ncbi:putative MFS family arabinose efflux permease [Prauserella sediminis]|uniref:Putative MFS family arabinose efflux permease n=1 Tax=Prauserella sediminis TaxID=577680 RepID=A0A839XQN9_9PSEU|nr:MFS transporter [Prauserella sediminis]MBB3664269.1 putative MFS family arabinose efflux permease [Prauserella sediminis]
MVRILLAHNRINVARDAENSNPDFDPGLCCSLFLCPNTHSEVVRVNDARRRFSYLLLCISGGVVFQVAYIRFVFLEPTYHALGLTAQEYGDIMSVFGAVAAVMYFVGGWFADRFAPRTLVVAALVITGLADMALTTIPGYAAVLLAHVAMAFAGMALYWPALVKVIGSFGPAEQQGRLFGFLEAIRGVTSTLISGFGAYLVGVALAPTVGVLVLIAIYGGLCLVLAALIWFALRGQADRVSDGERSALSIRQLISAARNKYTWLLGGTIMLMYCFYTTLGYFSPMLQHDFGVTAGLIGILGVVRSYVFQFVAGPLGGFCVDKVTRSTPRFLRFTFAGATLCVVVLLILPSSAALQWAAVTLMFMLSLMVFASRGVYWASITEARIPEDQRGGVIGLASGLAYLPDAFLPGLVASWIGDPTAGTAPNGGYTALFGFLAVVGVLGLVLTSVTLWVQRREPVAEPDRLTPTLT